MRWARRWARSTWRVLSARGKAAHPRHDAGHRAGHGQGHRRAGLDERRNQNQGQRKAALGDEQDRLSRQVARLLHAAIVRGDALGNQMRVRQFNVARDLAKIGKPVDKGEWMMSAAHRERLLRPAAEQRELPRRLLAAAVLQRQGGRRGQLRRYGLDHRPRTDPWLRR